jgi:radical SAM protein with 4Fe4S-binding SPASM domain
VTRKCKYHCRHCRADASEDHEDNGLSTAQWKEIFSSIADVGKCMIILTGGEPLEREDIYQLISYGKSVGLRMVVATCGYAVDSEVIVKLKDAGVGGLSFSLDGSTASTHDAFRQYQGSFDLTVNAAKLAKEAGIRFQINTTICKINSDEIIAIADLAHRMGACCFNPFILVPTGRASDITTMILDSVEYEALLNELLKVKLTLPLDIRVTCGPQFTRICKQDKYKPLNSASKGCMGGRGFGFISYKGDVQTCGFLDISAGNLVNNNYDFKGIWFDSEFLKEIRNHTSYKGRCGSCQYVTTCGGCRARAYALTGDYLAHDPLCDHLRDAGLYQK